MLIIAYFQAPSSSDILLIKRLFVRRFRRFRVQSGLGILHELLVHRSPEFVIQFYQVGIRVLLRDYIFWGLYT
jgi:hypothetical protein